MGDDYRTSVENIVENAAAAERERCIAALQQEGQNALDSGIRPSEPELSAWNYVGKHFRDNAAAILADPEAPSDDEVEPPSDEVWKHLPVSRFEAPSDD